MLVWSEAVGKLLPGPAGQEDLLLLLRRFLRTPLSSTAMVAGVGEVTIDMEEVNKVIDLNPERGAVKGKENTNGGKL